MIRQPFVLWFTGLSGAGKTTLAHIIKDKLEILGYTVELFDGDSIRSIFPKTGFDKQSRMDHIMRIGYVAGILEKHGIVSVVSLISPYDEARNFARMQCKQFIEIYVSAPLQICEGRDVKGLYAMARSGKISNFTGIDDTYEIPKCPELIIDTSNDGAYTSARKIYSYLEKRKLVP